MREMNLSRFLWMLFLLSMSSISLAETNDDLDDREINNTSTELTNSELEIGQWNISLAFGLGEKSNPLVGGDNLPLLILPDISFYGDNVYFDNGDLGYTLNETDDHSFSLLTRFNFEKAYFSRTHPANILFPSHSAEDFTDTEIQNLPRPSIEDVGYRDFAIDLGLQYHYFVNDSKLFRFQFLADASNVYNGFNGLVEYQFQSNYQQLRISTTLGLVWKSRELVDYYYGIDSSDEVDPIFYYQGKSSINPYIKLSAVYPLNAQWQLISMLDYSKLGNGMRDSPIVKDSSAHTFFVGVAYQF